MIYLFMSDFSMFAIVCPRQDLGAGHWTLSLADGSLFLHSQENFVVKQHEELFSFGSGDYVRGAEAQDVMSDVGGRWLCYEFSGLASEHYCIVEHSQKLPGHLKEQDWFNKVHRYPHVND